jgi:hypothetical protein
MVTSRSTGSRADGFKIRFNNYLSEFATTVVVNSFTKTFDSMGRILTRVPTSTTIAADIQWANKRDLQHLNIADAEVGDGMLFTKVTANINLEDEIVYNNSTWRIVAQIEGEQVGGELVYLGFLIRKNVQV